ncbi:MAG: tetratricopeptide repeat protein [Rhodospirillales bacterium]|nr:tetratricopeptide repeat protein [Rhodospirillales bacterium]
MDEALVLKARGNALAEQGRLEEAMALYRQALELQPDLSQAWFNLGTLAAHLGRTDEAQDALEKATQTDPTNRAAWNSLGILLAGQVRSDEAERAFAAAIAADPADPQGHYNRAVLDKAEGRTESAMAGFAQVIALDPDHVDARTNLGVLLLAADDLDGAETQFRIAVRLAPDRAHVHHNMGNLWRRRHRPEAAEAFHRKALACDPTLIAARVNLGRSLDELGRLGQAEASFRQALADQPDHVEALIGLGKVLCHLGRPDEAVPPLSHARSLGDAGEASFNMAIARLMVGDLKAGWADFGARWRLAGAEPYRAFRQPVWDGRQPLADRQVLVWREQGVGDEITFAAALPDLIARAGQVIVETSPKLIPLFVRAFPNADIRPEDRSRDATRDDFDLHLPIGDLFGHVRSERAHFPARPAYLAADADATGRWRARLAQLGPGPKVGISWRSGLITADRRRHFVSNWRLWQPVLEVPGVVWINLQYGAHEAELALTRQALGIAIHRFDDLDLFNDLDETAAYIRALDLVVGTGTTTDILAGALGAPTWITRLRYAHWDRLGGDNMPWLPTVRLFQHQPEEGWEPAIASIARALGERFPI